MRSCEQCPYHILTRLRFGLPKPTPEKQHPLPPAPPPRKHTHTRTHTQGNTQSVFEMMIHSIPFMRQAGKDANCSIVNVSSVNGLQSFGSCVSYCASKAAVDQITRSVCVCV